MYGHAVITGGGIGIGASVSAALKRAGATVTVLGRSEDPLRACVARGDANGHVVADVTDEAALNRALAEAIAARGEISILVNNAGSAETDPFLKAHASQFSRMFEVHVMAAVRASRHVLPGMIARGSGRVVNMASTAALKGYGYLSAYCAAKHALLGFTRALAVETARTGVTINAVCPGYTDTKLVHQSLERTAARTGRDTRDLMSAMLRHNPMQRLIEPDEVAACVVWLCSDAAAAVNGQAIAIDGGETAS